MGRIVVAADFSGGTIFWVLVQFGLLGCRCLTNGFSKKVENHAAQIALYLTTYNSHRVHMTLKTTPAVKAGIAAHVWSIERWSVCFKSWNRWLRRDNNEASVDCSYVCFRCLFWRQSYSLATYFC